MRADLPFSRGGKSNAIAFPRGPSRGGRRVARACIDFRFSFQTAFSHTGVIHRPCCLVGVGFALVFLSLTSVRERSAEWRYVSSLAPRRRRPRAFARHAALRRSTCGVFHPGTVLVGSEPGTFIPVIRAAFAALHPNRTSRPKAAALHSKGGREPRATRISCLRVTGTRAPRLLRH